MSTKGMGTAENAARWAGILLALAALATVIAVVGRVSADADQPTLMESLTAISENVFAYGIGGLARLVSGVALVWGASLLLKTWIIRDRYSTPLAPALFIISGIFTALSGLCAVVLAATAGDMVAFGAPSPSTEVIASFRWMAGKVGFTMAGLALIAESRYQWKVGGTLRLIAPISALLGAAMQLIWLDAATAVHQVTGVLFVMWLILIGGMFFTGRVERHFLNALDQSEQRTPA